jgi:hypothetical protein
LTAGQIILAGNLTGSILCLWPGHRAVITTTPDHEGSMGRAEVCLVSGQFSRLFVFGSVAVMSRPYSTHNTLVSASNSVNLGAEE